MRVQFRSIQALLQKVSAMRATLDDEERAILDAIMSKAIFEVDADEVQAQIAASKRAVSAKGMATDADEVEAQASALKRVVSDKAQSFDADAAVSTQASMRAASMRQQASKQVQFRVLYDSEAAVYNISVIN